MNAEFQKIARRDKKAVLSDQCKEIEKNNRMGKTRDLFKKIRNTKGTFHEKMGLIKDRNGMDLTEAEDVKKRWQEYTEELYKKIFMTQIITMVKAQHSETKIMASGPITSWEIDGETVETVSDFIFLGSKITTDGD